jgi:hypothetical protein
MQRLIVNLGWMRSSIPSHSFNQYRLSVSMNKKAYTLPELVNVAADSILKVNAIMHMAEASSAESKCGKKEEGF